MNPSGSTVNSPVRPAWLRTITLSTSPGPTSYSCAPADTTSAPMTRNIVKCAQRMALQCRLRAAGRSIRDEGDGSPEDEAFDAEIADGGSPVGIGRGEPDAEARPECVPEIGTRLARPVVPAHAQLAFGRRFDEHGGVAFQLGEAGVKTQVEATPQSLLQADADGSGGERRPVAGGEVGR